MAENNILKLNHNFGYQCRDGQNLQVLDTTTVIIAAGCKIMLLNLETGEQKFLEPEETEGIGHIVVDRAREHFAVGEKGHSPSIKIYKFPENEVYKVLKQETSGSYKYMDFNQDGDLLASVGGPPGYTMAIWQWELESRLLHIKAFSQEIFCLSFSPFLHGQLTTSGIGHIKFWKMAETFTGLKLEGEVGKFGWAEICDIQGYTELPDGKVVSGSEEGFLILWEGGLIKAMIRRRNGNPCHQGVIHQLVLEEGLLISAGSDGWIRTWYFESIDAAEPVEQAGFVNIEPMNELRVGINSDLRCISRSADPEEENIWYAQDAKGAIYLLDLSFSPSMKPPKCLFGFPSYKVTGCDICPMSHVMAISDMDRNIALYDFLSKSKIMEFKFTSNASYVLWAPLSVDDSGASIFVGFEDGVLRTMVILKKNEADSRNFCLGLKQVIKPHFVPITSIAINDKGTLLLTGSKDATVFLFEIDNCALYPLGFVNLSDKVGVVFWLPMEKGQKVVVLGEEQEVYEIELPEISSIDRKIGDKSYLIEGAVVTTLEWTSKVNMDTEEVDEYLMEGTEKKKLSSAWSSAVPGELWLAPGDNCCTYKFLLKEGEDKCTSELEYISTVTLFDATDCSVCCCRYSPCKNYAFLGLTNGDISFLELKKSGDLTTFKNHQSFCLHDNEFGTITYVNLTFDSQFAVTIGGDGNIFIHSFLACDQKALPNEALVPVTTLAEEVKDIKEPAQLSLEGIYQKLYSERVSKALEIQKQGILQRLHELQDKFQTLKGELVNMPNDFDIKHYAIPDRLKAEIQEEKESGIRQAHRDTDWEIMKLNLSYSKIVKRYKENIMENRFTLISFNSKENLASYKLNYPGFTSVRTDGTSPIRRHGRHHGKAGGKKHHLRRMSRHSIISSSIQKQYSMDRKAGTKEAITLTRRMSSFFELTEEPVKESVASTFRRHVDDRATELVLKKIEERKKRQAARKIHWNALYANKPEDVDIIIDKPMLEDMHGAYSLKSDPNYKVPLDKRTNSSKKKLQLDELAMMMHERKKDFNKKLKTLKEEKQLLMEIIDKVNAMRAKCDKSNTFYNYKGVLVGDSHKNLGPSGTLLCQWIMDMSKVQPDYIDKLEIPTIDCPLKTKIETARRITHRWRAQQWENIKQKAFDFFDSEFHLLKLEKVQLDRDLKLDEIKMMTIVEEFHLLKEYDDEGHRLENCVGPAKEDWVQAKEKLEECKKKVEVQKEVVGKMEENELAILTTLEQLLIEDDRLNLALSTRLKHRLNQVKLTFKEQQEGSLGSSRDISKSQELEENILSDKEETKQLSRASSKSCPEGCNPSLWIAVSDKQKEWGEAQMNLYKEKKVIQSLHLNVSMAQNDVIEATTLLKNVQIDLENLERLKQQKMNELNVVVCLHLHQIQHFKLPFSIPTEDVLVFPINELKNLKRKVCTLKEEIIEEKQKQKDTKLKHGQLKIECKEMEVEILKLKSQCDEEMKSRLGRIIHLDELEALLPSSEVTDLQWKQKKIREEQQQEMQAMKAKIQKQRDSLLEVKKENSQKVQQLATLIKENSAVFTAMKK